MRAKNRAIAYSESLGMGASWEAPLRQPTATARPFGRPMCGLSAVAAGLLLARNKWAPGQLVIHPLAASSEFKYSLE